MPMLFTTFCEEGGQGIIVLPIVLMPDQARPQQSLARVLNCFSKFLWKRFL